MRTQSTLYHKTVILPVSVYLLPLRISVNRVKRLEDSVSLGDVIILNNKPQNDDNKKAFY